MCVETIDNYKSDSSSDVLLDTVVHLTTVCALPDDFNHRNKISHPDGKLIGRFDVQRCRSVRLLQRDWGFHSFACRLKWFFIWTANHRVRSRNIKLPAFVSIPRVYRTVHQSWSIIEIGLNTGRPLAVWKTVETRRFATVSGCRHRASKPKTPDPASPRSTGWKSHCPTPRRSLCPRGYALTRGADARNKFH